jgi:two-component system, OmpR family, sensor histidine kinase ChvG
MLDNESWRDRIVNYRPSRIGLRLLAFNLLLVFLPVAGILYLDVYEGRLLEVQERGMVQQARLVAAALGGHDALDPVQADALLSRFGQRGEARIRVYDTAGALIADSARAPAPPERIEASSEYTPRRIRDRVLYRVAVWIVGVRKAASTLARRILVSPRTSRSAAGDTPAADHGPEPLPEIRAALHGQYGAAYYPTPGQRSVTLYSALPIQSGDRVIGVALVSQSTLRILQALYDVRLRIFEIVVLSIGFAVVLGFIMSTTIVRPLVRLRRAAVALSDRRATPASFRRVDRNDEVGDLARSLEELTARLDAHIKLLESFAGDVSHEFKNPLASIRLAAEAIAGTDDPVERARLFGLLARDVDRLERLVSGVRELARIDAQIAHEAMETVDLGGLLENLGRGFAQRPVPVAVGVHTAGDLVVRGSSDRLAQVFENILENAAGFSPPRSPVDVVAETDGDTCVVIVDDRGPGFPPAHFERVFDRFFSFRPDKGGPRDHMGLGLAIAQAIVEGYGGAIQAQNRPGGGARIEVRLPRARRVQPNSAVAQIVSGAGSVSETR